MDILSTDLAQKCWKKLTAFFCKEHSKMLGEPTTLPQSSLLLGSAPSMGLGGVDSSQAEKDIKLKFPSVLSGLKLNYFAARE